MDETNKDRSVVGWIITIVVLVALGLGVYYIFDLGDKKAPVSNTDETSTYYVSVIQVKHQFKDGTHTYVGVLDLPDPCYRIDSQIMIKDRMAGENVTDTNVISINTPRDKEEVCAQVVTTKTFRVEIGGVAGTLAEGYLNGREVQLNIFEVPANQNIDTAEFDTKG